MALLEEQVDELARCIAKEPELALPARIRESNSQAVRIEYLRALLLHDPGVFLERHGKHLDAAQREVFQPLRADYEVDFWMKVLEDADAAAASRSEPGAAGKISSTAKNRRLAKLQRLASEGYFDEEAARKRAPLLHHQLIGQYRKPGAQPTGGASLHEKIMEQQEELALRARMQQEAAAESAAGAAFEATLSESESDAEAEPAEGGAAAGNREGEALDGGDAVPTISAEELEQNRAEFDDHMRARFLSGLDGGAEADADQSLDEHWAKQAAQDAEDRYFDDA